ncbi:DNA helicase [Tanacetum coccineum]
MFAYNTANEDDRHLTYLEFPSEFVWYADRKSWSPRRINKSSIGRLTYVHPNLGELFFLRMLLCHQKGCRDIWELQKLNHIRYPSYRAACEALGLLGDDKEWEISLKEACGSATLEELRFVFSHILLHCDITNPSKLWNKYWKEMSHDMPRRVSEMVQLPDYHLNNDSLQGYTLYEIEVILNNYGKSFQNFGLTPPQKDMLAHLSNRLLNGKKELNFVYGYGETGKTFLWKTIISTLRSEGKIVLVVASSGIASSLLPSGRTSHSWFKLPLELTEESLCKIIKNTHLGKLLSDTDLIIWGEAPMNDQRCFEALDRTLRDILNEPSSLFGDKSVLLENMRLARPDISLEERSMVNLFASWLLDVGDGKDGQLAKEDPENTSWIDVPPSSCVPPNDQGLLNLIDFIYDQNTLQMPSAATLQQKAIICPKNKTAVVINSKVLDMVLDERTIYMSQDEATPTGNDGVET